MEDLQAGAAAYGAVGQGQLLGCYLELDAAVRALGLILVGHILSLKSDRTIMRMPASWRHAGLRALRRRTPESRTQSPLLVGASQSIQGV